MKKFLLVTIIGFVLTALAAIGAPQPLTSPPAPAQAECDCNKLEALQIELRNALGLQQAFRTKIADLRKLEGGAANNEFQKFAAATAKLFNRPPGDTGPESVEYTPYGNGVDSGILKNEKETPERREQLCGLSRAAKLEIEDMKRGASCAGIAKAVEAHEGVHWASCRRSGYIAFRDMHGADRAQEEVEAYGAQIAVLRAEIAKVLEHTNVRIEFESEVRAQWPPNPAITAEIIEVRAEVTMDRVSASGDMIKLEGQGIQTNNARLEGHCSFTGGLPFTLTSRGSLETDGLEAQIRLTTDGTSPTLKAQCTVEGQTGSGWTMPVKLNSGGNAPVINMPLKNRAEKVFDQSTGEGAKIVGQAGIKLSGQVKIRLILCEQSK